MKIKREIVHQVDIYRCGCFSKKKNNIKILLDSLQFKLQHSILTNSSCMRLFILIYYHLAWHVFQFVEVLGGSVSFERVTRRVKDNVQNTLSDPDDS